MANTTNPPANITLPSTTEPTLPAGGSTTTPNVPSNTAGQIRNINQTVQEREIIKTAPDLVIYLDGKTYLLNPYITSANQSYTFVSFNDYMQNFTMSCDTDSLIPSCNFTLQVPNYNKRLFQSPGGENLIQSMMEVQVFAKGYYAAANGNTIYYRVFKGVTAHIGHTDNGVLLEISVQCLGIMHFMEYMYMDLSPAVTSNSDRLPPAMATNQSAMNPYQMLADVFLRGITFEGFELNNIPNEGTIADQKVSESYWGQSVEAGYIAKWQPILVNLRKEVHILGFNMSSNTVATGSGTSDQAVASGIEFSTNIDGFTHRHPDSKGKMDPTILPAGNSVSPNLSQIQSIPDYYVDCIRGYLPDSNAASTQLANGRITSRLERIRVILAMIGYEGFQDLDGTIIFKPPLYNLNVRQISDPNDPPMVQNTALNITDSTNPFIVHLSEIEAESESEDEQAIKTTRVSISPTYTSNLQMMAAANTYILPAVTHVDIAKMAKFGLREEPSHVLPWLSLTGDKTQCYMYAVSEMNRANRGWRQYNLTIPLRPELKLGYPMYLPHKDMYGYIKTIGISYSQGGAATMSIMLDTLRKRPLFPSSTAGSAGNTSVSSTQNNTLYTTQPNLVMQWTTPPPQPPAGQTATTPASATTPTSNTPATSSGNGTSTSQAVLKGQPATLPQNSTKPIYPEELEIISNRRTQLGTSWSTRMDTRTNSFFVQNDTATPTDASSVNGAGASVQSGKPFFSKANWGPLTSGVNATYLQKILSSQPYTDEGGYEVISPFPWGRWRSLKRVIAETHLGVIPTTSTSTTPTIQETQTISGTDVFLFAGVGNPNSSGASSNLQQQVTSLSTISQLASSATSFELVTPQPGSTQSNILNGQQPDTTMLLNTVEDNVEAATNAFLTGTIPPQPGSALSLATQITTGSPDAVGSTPTAPVANSQSQQFISSLIDSNNP